MLDTPQVAKLVGTPQSNQPMTPQLPKLNAAPQRTLSVTTSVPKRSRVIEIRVLFRRTAQNIFRHRSLLMLHVVLSLVLALFGGLIFNHVTNDLAGFQNRSGAFYFILTFFGFASMSSMDLFIAERSIFLRETGEHNMS